MLYYMKRISTLLLTAAISITANAESTKMLKLGTLTPGVEEPGLVAQGISPNGKYVCGNLEMGMGYFIYNLENDECVYDVTSDPEGAELRHVNNNGLAIGYNGPGITFSMDKVETVLETPSEEYKYVLGEALTNDGSVMIGELVGSGYITYAAYSANGGKWTMLPQGDSETLGQYAESGSTAKYISGDGKVILGQAGGLLGPSILWLQNEQGEYELYPLFTTIPEEYLSGDKAFHDLSPASVSDNGKYVLMTALTIIGDPYDPEMGGQQNYIPVVYNTETQDWTIYDEPQTVDEYGLGLRPTAIDNDGNIIGIIGIPNVASSGSFYLKAGATQAMSYLEAFPSYAEIFGLPDSVGYCLPTCMSADGRYLVGYGYYSEDFYDESKPAYWTSYVIDTRSDSGVAAPSVTESNVTVEGIYTIAGQRQQHTVKGVNIILMSDGSTRKVIIK